MGKKLKKGRPQRCQANESLLRKLAYKKQAMMLESYLLEGLSKFDPEKLSLIPSRSRGRGKVILKLENIIELQFPTLSEKQKKQIYQVFQTITQNYEFQNYKDDSLPDKLFHSSYDLSYVFVSFKRQLSVEEQLILALFCLWKKKYLQLSHIDYLKLKMEYLLKGLQYGLNLMKQAKNQKKEKKKYKKRIKKKNLEKIGDCRSQKEKLQDLHEQNIERLSPIRQLPSISELNSDNNSHEAEQQKKKVSAQVVELYQVVELKHCILDNSDRENQLNKEKAEQDICVDTQQPPKERGKKDNFIKPESLNVLLINFILYSYYYAKRSI